MLGPALYLIVVMTLIATVAVSGIGAVARADVLRLAERSLDPGIRDAIARYQSDIETTITQDPGYAAATGGSAPGPLAVLANPGRLPVASYVGQRSTLTLRERVVPTTLAAPTCAGPDAQTQDLAAHVQCDSWVQETRASLTVTVDVLAPDQQTVLAHRDVLVTLRVFATPPFSAVSGMKDTTTPRVNDGNVNDEGTAAHEDDSGGRESNVLAPDRRGGPAADGAGDTAIHVQYECRGVNCDQPRPPSADRLTDRHWQNGNTVNSAP